MARGESYTNVEQEIAGQHLCRKGIALPNGFQRQPAANDRSVFAFSRRRGGLRISLPRRLSWRWSTGERGRTGGQAGWTIQQEYAETRSRELGRDMSVEIVARQSTFWELRQGDALLKIHFRKKHEFSFSTVAAPSFEIVQDHPLLLEYQHPMEELYVSGPATDPAAIVHEISDMLVRRSEG